MNLSELLPLIEARNAELAGRFRRFILLWGTIYVLSLVVGNLLSASGMGHVNGMFMFLYLVGILTLPLNLTFWEVLAIAGFVTAQPGGEKGFSFQDGIDKIWKWTAFLFDKQSLYLVFWAAVPYFVLYEVDTTGMIGKVFFLLPLLPPMVYFWTKWSPHTRTAFAIVGYALTAAFVINLSLGIANTVQRTTADPAAVAVLDYLDQVGGVNKTNDKLVAESIISKLKAKKALTADEQKAWDILRKEAEAQSLRPGSLKQKAEAFVENAKPADKSWWKAHWVTVGGIALAIAIGYFLFGRMRGTTAGATPAAAPAHGAVHGGTRSRLGWILTLAVLLALGGWVWYSIDDWRYERTLPLTIRDMNDQRLCGIRPGTWRFSFPGEQLRENEARRGRSQAVGIFVRSQDGRVNRYSVISNLMINDTFTGNEKVDVGQDGCVKVSFFSPAEFKKTAVLLGGDMINHEKPRVFDPDAPARPYTTLVRFAND